MKDFVDAADPIAVEAVLRQALAVIGLPGVLVQLESVPGLQVETGRPRGIVRAAVPASVSYGDRVLRVSDRSAELVHVVGGIALAADNVLPSALPGVLAALVARAVDGHAAGDAVSVLLTALRDAVTVGQGPSSTGN